MEIEVKRSPSFLGATLGDMTVNGVFECYTLEDAVREVTGEPVAKWKVPGKTAIPRGRYRVIVDYSPHFGKDMPHLLDVPGYDGVRIHSGNDAADTEGCILVGQTKEANLIYQSRAAFKALFSKIQAALTAGEPVYLTVA